MINGRYEDADGIYWYKDGVLHRTDGPAVVFTTGTKFWFWHGKYHRLDGPEVEGEYGYQAWFVDGQEVDIVAILGYEPTTPISTDEQIIIRLSI